MNKFIVRILVVMCLVFAIFMVVFSQPIIAIYILSFVLFLEIYMVYRYLNSQKNIVAVLKNLKSFRVTKRTQKLLVQKDSEFSELILEINHLMDEYEQLKIDKKLQATNSKELLSNLSHDIRTPLTSIIGYVDALNDGVITSEEEFKEFIGILSMKSKNLKDLTDQIFNVARIDADDVIMNLEYIELNEFLRNTIIDFIPMLEKNKLEFKNDIMTDRFMVHVDRLAITRVFQNVIKNAIQHGKDGNVIGVKSFIANNYYRVIIWDKGKGIPKAKQKHVFERLFKVDDARKFGATNSGLGMAIAKKLINKLGGNIFLKSEENELTEFYIELPILKELNI